MKVYMLLQRYMPFLMIALQFCFLMSAAAEAQPVSEFQEVVDELLKHESCLRFAGALQKLEGYSVIKAGLTKKEKSLRLRQAYRQANALIAASNTLIKKTKKELREAEKKESGEKADLLADRCEALKEARALCRLAATKSYGSAPRRIGAALGVGLVTGFVILGILGLYFYKERIAAGLAKRREQRADQEVERHIGRIAPGTLGAYQQSYAAYQKAQERLLYMGVAEAQINRCGQLGELSRNWAVAEPFRGAVSEAERCFNQLRGCSDADLPERSRVFVQSMGSVEQCLGNISAAFPAAPSMGPVSIATPNGGVVHVWGDLRNNAAAQVP